MVAAGLSPLEALHAATGGAARIIGAERDFGTIEPGKWADLVILDAAPRPTSATRGGFARWCSSGA